MSYSGINKKVFDKISEAEVKLSSDVVELESVDDLIKVISKYEKMNSTLDKMTPMAKKTYAEYKKLLIEEDEINKQIDVNDIKLVDKIKKQLKELGIKESNVPEIQKIKNLFDDFGDKRREFQKALRGQ